MTTAPLVLVFVGAAVLVVAITAGLLVFLLLPGLAKAVKLAEADPHLAARIKQARILHPEIVKIERIDRHDAYVWLHLGLWCVALGIIFAPAPNTVLTALSWDAQKLLGLCMLCGSSTALVGISLGMRLGGWRLLRPISDNIVSDHLGDDIRMPYTFGCLGMLSVAVSLAGYGWTIFQYATLIGTLGGGLTFAIVGMCITLSRRFILGIRAYTRARNTLVNAVLDARS